MGFFCLSTSNILLHSLLASMASEVRLDVSLTFVSLYIRCWKLWVTCLDIELALFLFVWFWHSYCLVFSELPGSIVLCLMLSINWGKFSLIIVGNILFLSSFFCYSHYAYVIPPVVVPQPSDTPFCYFRSLLFSLLFHFGGFFWDFFKLRGSFPSCV